MNRTQVDGQEGIDDSTVDIRNHMFNPPEMNIKTGMTIRFSNSDEDEHTVTADDGVFDEELKTNDSVDLTFEEPGTYNYFCRYHPEMKGTVVVE